MEIIQFNFDDKQIRSITDENGEPWFVLGDVLSAMGSTTTVTAAKSDIEDGLGDGLVTSIPILDRLGRRQNTHIINESAVTFLLAQSRTDAGKRLNRQIHTEILPSIRKTGSYMVPQIPPALPNPVKEEFDLQMHIVNSMAAVLQIDRTVAVASVLAHVDSTFGTDLHATFRSALPAAISIFMDPTALDEALKVPKPLLSGRASATNLLLERHGYQKKIGGAWVPTELAEDGLHYRKSTFSRHGHNGVSLQWSREFVERLNPQ
ncbi:MAG: BRO-N domain-containing protein [Fluviibacter sp.]